MDEPPNTAPGTAAADSPPAASPDLVGMAAHLAAKHSAKPGSAARPAPKPLATAQKGGRKPVAQEVSEYLAKNNLRAVPLDTAGNAPLHQDQPPKAPPYVVSPEFVQECAGTLLKGIEAFRQRQVFLKALKLAEDKELAKGLATEAAAPPGAIDVMARCSAEIAQKYGALTQWTPEVMLFVAGATWFGKDLALNRKLNELSARKKEAEKPSEVKPPVNPGS